MERAYEPSFPFIQYMHPFNLPIAAKLLRPNRLAYGEKEKPFRTRVHALKDRGRRCGYWTISALFICHPPRCS